LNGRYRYFLLVAFALQCVLSMRQKSATYDEWGFITSGLQLLRPSLALTGWDRQKLVNPPVGRLPNALPLAALKMQAPGGHAVGSVRSDTTLTREGLKLIRTRETFPFSWDTDPRRLLLLARLPTVIEGVLLGLLVAWWAGKIGGRGAQSAALLLYCFSPNVLAHSRLATVDVAASLSFVGAAALAGRAIVRGGPLRMGVAGLVLALALQTKLSAHLLLPMLLVAAVAAWRLEKITVGHALLRAAAVSLIGVSLNWVIYGVSLARVAAGTRYAAGWAGGLTGWPGMAYRAYRASVSLVETSSMKGFLVGHHYWDRHWTYYPIAIATKTPLGVLLLTSLAVGLFGRLGRARCFWHWWTVIPPTLLVTAAATRGLNVGLRHLLPAYPFVHAGAGAALAWLWRRRGPTRPLSVLIGGACVAAGLSVYPHYLAYFNCASGGPDRGHRLLVDSNLDWGQDLPALASWQRGHGIRSVRLSYFGTDLPEVYGVSYSLPSELEAYRPHPGWYAVSATNLEGLYSYPDLDRWAWLRRREPVAKVGHTIFVFRVDLPSAPGGSRRCEE
jgi:hypothetical protein